MIATDLTNAAIRIQNESAAWIFEELENRMPPSTDLQEALFSAERLIKQLSNQYPDKSSTATTVENSIDGIVDLIKGLAAKSAANPEVKNLVDSIEQKTKRLIQELHQIAHSLNEPTH